MSSYPLYSGEREEIYLQKGVNWMTTTKRPAPSVPVDVRERYEGKTVLVGFGDLEFQLHVSEVRNRFGNFDLRVTPVAGDRRTWVESSRVVRVLD